MANNYRVPPLYRLCVPAAVVSSWLKLGGGKARVISHLGLIGNSPGLLPAALRTLINIIHVRCIVIFVPLPLAILL